MHVICPTPSLDGIYIRTALSSKSQRNTSRKGVSEMTVMFYVSIQNSEANFPGPDYLSIISYQCFCFRYVSNKVH